MNYRKFGNTDLLVSEIGFGAWAIGGACKVGNIAIGWGPTDDAVSIKALEAALDAGINFFDTADFYGLGHSEKLIGDVIGNRSDAIVATKVGQRVGAGDTIVHDNSKAYIIEACEQSLKRLKRDAIDYYQLHVGKLSALQQGECIDAMHSLQRQGKIRYWGHSLFTWNPQPEAEFLMENNLGEGFQLVLNLANQRAIPVMQRAAGMGYGIIARMPLQFGLLTGKIKPSQHFNEEDHRSFRLTSDIIQRTQDIIKTEMIPMAKQYNTTPAGLALSFVLNFPEVSTVIPGIRTPEHVQMNTTQPVKLSAFDFDYLQELYTSKWKAVADLMEKQG